MCSQKLIRANRNYSRLRIAAQLRSACVYIYTNMCAQRRAPHLVAASLPTCCPVGCTHEDGASAIKWQCKQEACSAHTQSQAGRHKSHEGRQVQRVAGREREREREREGEHGRAPPLAPLCEQVPEVLLLQSLARFVSARSRSQSYKRKRKSELEPGPIRCIAYSQGLFLNSGRRI